MADESRESLAWAMASGSAQAPPGEKPSAPREPPNGGVAAWTKVVGAFLIFMNTWGIASSYGVFQAYYQKTLFPSDSTSSISWIGSLQAFLLVIMGMFTGPLFDMGLLRHLLIVGNFLIVLGVFMLSLATQYWQVLLTQGLCFGLGSGLLYVPTIALVATQFTTKRTVAVGLASTGSAIGGIIYPILFRQLQPSIGFGWTIRIIAFIALALAAGALILIRDIPKAPRRRKMFQLRAWTELPFAFFSLSLFFGFLAFWIPFVYVPTYALTSLGTSEDLAFYMLCVVNAGSFLGRIVPAYIAQKLGPMQVFIAATLACSVLLFGWIGVYDLGGFAAFAALFGFFSGVLVSVPPATIAHPVLSPSLDVLGTRLGMLWSMTGMGVLVGSPIAGAFVDASTGSTNFKGAQVFAGCCMAVASVMLVVPLLAILRYDRKRGESDATRVEIAAAVAGLEGSGAGANRGLKGEDLTESSTEKRSQAETSRAEEGSGSGAVEVEDGGSGIAGLDELDKIEAAKEHGRT